MTSTSNSYTPAEYASYFLAYMLAQQESGSVTIDEYLMEAETTGFTDKINDFCDPTPADQLASFADVDKQNGIVHLSNATPVGECPATIEQLFDHLGVAVPDAADVNAHAAKRVGAGANSKGGENPDAAPHPLVRQEVISESQGELLADAGLDTLESVAAAGEDKLATLAGITPAEASQAVEHAELNADPEAILAREAVATDLGLDPGLGETLSLDELESKGESRTPSADVVAMEDVKQTPGKPIRVTDSYSTGDDWHYHTLPILESVDHPLVPDATDMVAPYDPLSGNQQGLADTICKTLARNNRGLLLEGPHGAGKNHWIEWVMAMTQRPMIPIDIHESMLAEQLIGSMMPQEDGTVAFESKFIPYAIKNGISLVFNELRSARADVQTALHQLLNANQLIIEESQERIVPHPAFRFIATTNPDTNEYDAAGSLDAAFLDRLRVVNVDYLGKNAEVELLSTQLNSYHTQVSQEVINGVVSVAQASRDDATTPTISTRRAKDILEWSYESGAPREVVLRVINTLASRRDDISPLVELAKDKVPEDNR